nr:hypothetical protein CFP56_29339 [Quercus suber]
MAVCGCHGGAWKLHFLKGSEMVAVYGWVSRWSLEAPFPSRIGDGGSLWVGVTVLMRIGDGGSLEALFP